MELIRKLFDALFNNPTFTPAEPGYDPMDEPARRAKPSNTLFYIFVFGMMITAFFFFNGRRKANTAEAAAITELTQVAAYTPTLTITPTPSDTPTPITPTTTTTVTTTVTTTPPTVTPSKTASLTPAPKIIYQNRTVIITVKVPWVITQLVPVTVVVTATVTNTPTITNTPSITLSITPTITGTLPTPTGTPTETPTPTEIIY